jgi:hypothetical protein
MDGHSAVAGPFGSVRNAAAALLTVSLSLGSGGTGVASCQDPPEQDA